MDLLEKAFSSTSVTRPPSETDALKAYDDDDRSSFDEEEQDDDFEDVASLKANMQSPPDII
jgi:hypothetical protein